MNPHVMPRRFPDHRPSIAARVLLLLLLAGACAPAAAEWRFDVRFDAEVRQEPFTGRVYVFFSEPPPPGGAARGTEPRFGPNWFHPGSFLAQDVEAWRPGEPLVFDGEQADSILAYPRPLAEMDLAGLHAQAVARFNPHEPKAGTGTGNGYGPVVPLRSPPEPADAVRLTIDRLVPPRAFPENRWTRLLEVRSDRLSDFHERDVFLRAAVRLPASYYDQPDRRYPAVFEIPGFSGTHFHGISEQPAPKSDAPEVEFLWVTLDPTCPLGHHTFADSANNGPVGTALIEEFLPEFNRRFRSLPRPSARFLTGHSSGGWSSLWLQVTYPGHFGGTWSTAPDPVDFRDFQQINLYRPGENMYVDADGQPRPIARRGGRPVLWYRGFAEMEWVLGHGGQLHSFEAVFSPRDAEGRPRLLWDRRTGEIDLEVARAWEDYDIRLVLERNWETLEPKLRGRLNVFMGDEDTFYLEGATVLLKESLERLGSDAVVEIHAGRDHSNLLTPELRARIRREMGQAFLDSTPVTSPP